MEITLLFTSSRWCRSLKLLVVYMDGGKDVVGKSWHQHSPAPPPLIYKDDSFLFYWGVNLIALVGSDLGPPIGFHDAAMGFCFSLSSLRRFSFAS